MNQKKKNLFFQYIQKKWDNFASLPSHILRNRADQGILLFLFLFFCAYLLVFSRLFYFGLKHKDYNDQQFISQKEEDSRPDIIDRNGQLLAKDIRLYSLYAEPKNILDAKEATELLLTVFPYLDKKNLYQKLTKKSSFVWLQREITPIEKNKIIGLGIPGLNFLPETKRFYPQNFLASHILGYVNIDNQGLAGIEKYIDQEWLKALKDAGLNKKNMLKPLQLSIDIRIQSVMRDVVEDALNKYQAPSGGAVLLDIRSGEIIGMVSLPDFNSNNPIDALKSDRLNRITGAAYEMGSTIKGITTAMALASKKFTLDSFVDATKPLKVGKNMFIHDYYGKKRELHIWEVFLYSSNIGSAQEVLGTGVDFHREFLKKVGLLDRMKIELPEVATPVLPNPWSLVNSLTISFGHGFTTTPLQLSSAMAGILNKGMMIHPTFLKQDENYKNTNSTRLVSEEISEEMRYLFRLNGIIGSGRHAQVLGYRVGGKTGTAEKVENGKYVKKKNFNSFLAAFPMDNPQYILCTIIDSPQAEEGTHITTSAMNAAPMAQKIIEKSAVFLKIQTDFTKENDFDVQKYIKFHNKSKI